MNIGSAWIKVSEKTGKTFLSVSLDEAVYPLTITEDKFISLWEISEEDRKKENAPHYRVTLSKSKPQEENK